MTIAAEAVVPAAPEAVFRFLSDLGQHWRLAGGWIEVLETGTDGATVRIRGPLLLRRTAATRVDAIEPVHRLAGTAELAGGTRARVSWHVHEDAGGAMVRLTAEVEHASGLDRALLAVGGRVWMRRRFRQILARLAAALREG